jgi:hypothetical protein
LYAVQELSHRQANRSFNDLAFLTNELPLVKGKYNPITMEAIKILVDINQINHYSNYIYPINPEINTLHQVLSVNSEHASRFSAFVIEQMTQFNSNEYAELAEHFLKRIIKYSLPLGMLLLTLIGIQIFEPTVITVLT